MGGGFRYSYTFCEILVAMVFGLENPTLLAKSGIFIPNCTKGVGFDRIRKFSKKNKILSPSLRKALFN